MPTDILNQSFPTHLTPPTNDNSLLPAGKPRAPTPGSKNWFMALAYAEWLFNERRILCAIMGWDVKETTHTPAGVFHFPPGGDWRWGMPPMWRGAAVMDTAGVDLNTLATWAREAAARAKESGLAPEQCVEPDAVSEARLSPCYSQDLGGHRTV
ncbi:hypothetical protein ABLE91_24225 [Aquabacter sp. CN5-332]|uniref:hypothetical protein n=1 Tax=Aquabacter sp. CN5-332 TaxID=3156608 RepID=UPI0032B37FBC